MVQAILRKKVNVAQIQIQFDVQKPYRMYATNILNFARCTIVLRN
jgi:hypothetical protein